MTSSVDVPEIQLWRSRKTRGRPVTPIAGDSHAAMIMISKNPESWSADSLPWGVQRWRIRVRARFRPVIGGEVESAWV